MALILIEGFDGASNLTGDSSAAATKKYLEARYSGSYTSGVGPRSYTGWGNDGHCLSFGRDGFGGGNNFYVDLGGNQQEVIVGMAIRPTPVIQTYNILRWRNVNESRVHCRVAMLIGKHIQIHRTNATALLGTAYNVLHPQRWNYIEIRIKIDDTAGEVELKANGVQILNLSSQDTRDGGTTAAVDNIEVVGVAGQTTDNIDQNYCIDDLYVLDTTGSAPHNTFLGPIKVEELRPDADGDVTNFTPQGAGSNYVEVDDHPRDDDTTYNSDSTSANKDLFTAANLSLIDGTVFGVQVAPECRVTDATTYGVKPKCKHSTTEGTGTSQTVSDTSNYTAFWEIFILNPSTSTAWTATTVNAMQIGYEVA